jgi:hypothetical protein
MVLSIKFKDKEIFNANRITFTSFTLFIINEFAFSIIVYSWYILYKIGIISSINPYFALIVTLIQNIILFIYLMSKGLSQDDLIKYFIILIVIKILTIYSMRNDRRINYIDVYACVYMYIIYIFIFIIFWNLILKKNKDVFNIMEHDLINDSYNRDINSKIYDVVYNDMILQII